MEFCMRAAPAIAADRQGRRADGSGFAASGNGLRCDPAWQDAFARLSGHGQQPAGIAPHQLDIVGGIGMQRGDFAVGQGAHHFAGCTYHQ